MIRFRQKEFGLLSNLFGGKKPIEMSTKDLLKEYEKPGIKVDPIVLGKLYNSTKIPKSKIPKDLQEYLTILKNNFPGDAKFIQPKTGDIMFGWDEIIKTTNRFVRTFGEKGAIIILGTFKEEKTYVAFFPKAQQIWIFDIAWGLGGYSQGLFGLGCGIKEAIKIHLK